MIKTILESPRKEEYIELFFATMQSETGPWSPSPLDKNITFWRTNSNPYNFAPKGHTHFKFSQEFSKILRDVMRAELRTQEANNWWNPYSTPRQFSVYADAKLCRVITQLNSVAAPRRLLETTAGNILLQIGLSIVEFGQILTELRSIPQGQFHRPLAVEICTGGR